MNQLVLHIEYLLHEHNCVIVPGLGGFVVNTNTAFKRELSIFEPSYCELVFNSFLTHNDGLLVESYMQTDNIPFESALQRIEKAVKELRQKLNTDKRVSLDDLGEFTLSDSQQLVYNPKPFVRPELYGLTTAALKPIIQLKTTVTPVTSKPEESETRKSIPKISIAAAVAAVIALVFFVFPLQDSVNKHQSAKLLTESNIFAKTEKQKNRPSTYDAFSESLVGKKNESNAEESNKEAVTSTEDHQYYIIVGVYEVRDIANRMLERLKSDGFDKCNSIEKPDRIDVYAASFTTREEANKVASEMRKNFDMYQEAWVKKIK